VVVHVLATRVPRRRQHRISRTLFFSEPGELMVRKRTSTFGSVRKLASGRYQASYWHEGERHIADHTFDFKADADAWLANVRTDIGRGHWLDPRGGREHFDDYAKRWMRDRHDLRPRTREIYDSQLKCHLVPAFGALTLDQITTAKVRSWHSRIAQTTPVTAAKCYRLLHAILATAVEDNDLVSNPCTIKRAGQERSPERPILNPEQVDALARAVPERYVALVYTAAYGGLRLGECSALTRERIDLVHRTIAVTEQAQQVNGQGRVIGPPKSDAGRRTVAIPKLLTTVLDNHLARFVGSAPTDLVFTADKGGPLVGQHFYKHWRRARQAVEVDGLRFHDLRHFAGTMAARTGATTVEVMARIGHSTPRAALIYQHATAERDHAIASGLDDLVAEAKAAPVAKVVELPRRTRSSRPKSSRT
jgi:integrase